MGCTLCTYFFCFHIFFKLEHLKIFLFTLFYWGIFLLYCFPISWAVTSPFTMQATYTDGSEFVAGSYPAPDTLWEDSTKTLTVQTGAKRCGLICSRLVHSTHFEAYSLLGLYYTWHEHHWPPLQAGHQLSRLLARLTSYITCWICCFGSDLSLKFRSCGFKFKAFCCCCLSSLKYFPPWCSQTDLLWSLVKSPQSLAKTSENHFKTLLICLEEYGVF